MITQLLESNASLKFDSLVVSAILNMKTIKFASRKNVVRSSAYLSYFCSLAGNLSFY